MKEIHIEKCPFCGGADLYETRAESYGGVYLSLVHHGGLRGAGLYATICRDCGSVVRAYCKEPEKLFPKKERRG